MLPDFCFEAIGFGSSGGISQYDTVDMAVKQGHRLSSPRGLCAYWPLGSGFEIWATFDRQRNYLQDDPHFSGTSRLEVQLLTEYDLSAELAGGLHVQANPRGDEPSQQYPIMFNVPNWDHTRGFVHHVSERATGPLIFHVQLTAFPEELHCFDTPEEHARYWRETQNMQNVFATGHFVPAGLFVEAGKVPGPQASFSGIILDGRIVTNPVTSQRRAYMSVKTLGAVIDVIADPTRVTGTPKTGGVASGYFWLSGRTYMEKTALDDYLARQGDSSKINVW